MSALDAPPAPPPTTRRARRRRNRRVVAAVVAVAACLLVVALAGGGWFWYELDAPGGRGRPVTVEVRQGWGVRRIGDELERRGVIGSALAFQLYAALHGGSAIRSGSYSLRGDLGVRDALRALSGAPVTNPEVGVLPGTTLDQVADHVAGVRRLSRAGFLGASASVRSRYEPPGINTLEGLLWPDSYPVTSTRTDTTLATTMARAFDEHASRLGLDATAAGLGVTPYQVITVASLVQREAKLDVDRPLIAAVVYNRLRANMLLQIDATVQYAPRGRERSGPITERDVAVASPYNTYQVNGLPPTPISTVGRKSLEAAMHPASVPYRYYVLSDASGKHAFAETFEQHQANVAAARAKGLLG